MKVKQQADHSAGGQIMFETFFFVILAAFVIDGIWAFIVTKKVKKEESLFEDIGSLFKKS